MIVVVRIVLAVVSVFVVILSQMVLSAIHSRRDGNSQWVLERCFVALRAYGIGLAINMSLNAIYGRAVVVGLWLFAAVNIYLIYSLATLVVLIRSGRRLP